MAVVYFVDDKVCTLRDRVTGEEEDFILEAPNGQGTFEIDINWVYENSYVDGEGLLQTPYNEGYIVLSFDYSSHLMQLYRLIRADEIDIPYSFSLQNDQSEPFVLLNEDAVVNFLSGIPIESLDQNDPYPYGSVTLQFATVSTKTRQQIKDIMYYAEPSARPNKPSGLSATASETGISVRWNDNSDSIEYYKVYFYVPGRGSSFWRRSYSSNYNLDNYYEGEVYDIWVTAVRDGMESLRSSKVSVTTPEPDSLASPTGLVATVGDTSIMASVDPYPVAVNSYNWYLNGNLIDTTTDPNYTFEGLSEIEYNIQCSVTVGGQESLRASTVVDLSGVSIAHVDVNNSPFSVTGQDYIIVDASGGTVTLNLPDSAMYDKEEFCVIKKDYTDNAVQIVPDGTTLISGESQYELINPNQSVCVMHDPQEWYLV